MARIDHYCYRESELPHLLLWQLCSIIEAIAPKGDGLIAIVSQEKS